MTHIENNPTAFGFNGGSPTLYGGSIQQDNDYADFLLGAVNSRTNSQIVDVVAVHTGNTAPISGQLAAAQESDSLAGLDEYFPVPVRGGARQGLEHFDFSTNTYEICGNGGIPNDCGIKVEKALFDPRVGVAYRPSKTTVVRAGYGISREQLNMFRDGIYNYAVRLAIRTPLRTRTCRFPMFSRAFRC